MGRYKEIIQMLDPSFNPLLVQQEILSNLSRSQVEHIVYQASCSNALFLRGPFMPWWLKNLGHLSRKGVSTESNFFQHCSQLSFDSDQLIKVGPNLFVLIKGFGSKYDEVRKKLSEYEFYDEEEAVAFSSLSKLFQLREETLQSFGLDYSFITSLIDSHGIPQNCFFRYCNSKIVGKTHTCTFLHNQSIYPCESNIGCNFVGESAVMSKAHHRLHLPNQCSVPNCKPHSNKVDLCVPSNISPDIREDIDQKIALAMTVESRIIVFVLSLPDILNYCISKLHFSAVATCNHSQSRNCQCALKILRCKNIFNSVSNIQDIALSKVSNIYNWSFTIPTDSIHCNEGDGFILSALVASEKMVCTNINDILNLSTCFKIKTFVFVLSSSFKTSSYQSNKDVCVVFL